MTLAMYRSSIAQPRWLRLPALFALAFFLWQPAQAQTSGATSSRSVTEWLTRMHEASRQRAYTGTLVVSAGPTLSASRIWHVCDGVQQMERVDTLTGSPRSTIRHNSDVITFAPESKTAWVDRRESLGVFPELLRTPNNAIADYYTAREKGVERVAGHLADVVDIVPRDPLRYGYRIWSEKKTGLVVKLQTVNDRGDVLEQTAFSELQLDAPVRMDKLKRLMADTKGYDVHKLVLKKTTAEAEGWRLKETVPGFQPMSCHTRGVDPARTAGSAPMQWVFSDGLASVSLFVEPFDAQHHGAEQGVAVTGATHSLARRVGSHWVSALGEVPPVTLARFVAALERTR
jgi:sigma-E factor negative regulatory protein RseB